MLLYILCFFTISFSKAQGSLTIGNPIPLANTKMKDISGKDVSIKDVVKSNGVLVMFSCNTCPYVIKNQARTKAITAFAKQNNIGLILLNSNEGGRDGSDSFSEMQAYAKRQGYDFSYAVDTNSKLADAFGATRTPEVYLFDAKGTLQYKGAIDDNPVNANNVKRIHTKEAITEMLGGKTVSVKESRSLGCAIKRL
ncbi:MAG: alkyl hydroperoxide reductase and/or thiol-specific antioxidant family (AhpC/TSA) protein [Conexibacter sp.]|nr:alkyl hydroperoxide reductase and/or thiol-specific antioxidant family (AhpC/TSA) protein [Conexibacter sp.]